MVRLSILVTLVLLVCVCAGAQNLVPQVTLEEDVYSFTPPDNGSGPMWNYGCTTILRLGGEVVVAQYDTDLNIPKLNRARWRLLRRVEGEGWKEIARADGFRQREPAILATLDRQSLLLNVNDSIMPVGTEYGRCFPHLLRFTLESPMHPQAIHPRWDGLTHFTDHSYRGFGVDADRDEILMLNIDAETSAEHWCLMNANGETLKNGSVSFPIRSCYPQVALKNGAGYVLAIGDIKEPVKEWAEFKFAQSGQAWDYVFRILYLAWSPDLKAQNFAAPLEIANVDATGGHISNQDLWIAPDGSAYIMYTEREVQTPQMRDKFFPDKSVLSSMHLAVAKDGQIVERRVLFTGVEGDEPGHARFHETADGRLLALVAFGGNQPRNVLVQIYPRTEDLTFVNVPFRTVFGSFLLANVRAGNAPSDTIDLLGHSTSGTTLSYGRVDLATPN